MELQSEWTWSPADLPSLTGKRFLITGASGGLGFFSTEQLAKAGATVLMTGKDPNKLRRARLALQKRVPEASARVKTLLLDTRNPGSVRSAAASAVADAPIDAVLLNAGIVHPPKRRQLTTDGHELVFATNVLGHFVLCAELLPTLAETNGRMVWVGSISTAFAMRRIRDIEFKRGYRPWRAYVQSKLATTLLGFEAARRLEDAQVPVTSVVAHPGYSLGGRTRDVDGVHEAKLRKRILARLQTPIAQSKERGAWALVRAVADPVVETGEYWGPGMITKGPPTLGEPGRRARNREAGQELWRLCEEATGAVWPFKELSSGIKR